MGRHLQHLETYRASPQHGLSQEIGQQRDQLRQLEQPRSHEQTHVHVQSHQPVRAGFGQGPARPTNSTSLTESSHGREALPPSIVICPFGDSIAKAPQGQDAGKAVNTSGLPALDLYGANMNYSLGPLKDLGTGNGDVKYGCIEFKQDVALSPQKKDELAPIPTVNDMIRYGRNLRRIATGDASQVDFQPLEPSRQAQLSKVSSAATSNFAAIIDDLLPAASAAPVAALTESDESNYKRNYVREALLLGEKQGISHNDMKKILLGIYAIEGFGMIPYDMQSGTDFKFSAPDIIGSSTNEDGRRNSKTRISSGVGYNQITYPANLHLLNDDHGAIAKRLRELSQDENSKPTERASELEEKAKFLEQLQGKLHDELINFAKQTPNGKAIYLDNFGQPNFRLYADFSSSNQKTSFGETGKEFTTGLHSLLLDSDIGPILQARQLNEDAEQTLRPEFQNYLQAKMLSVKAAAASIENLFANASGRMLMPKQFNELQANLNILQSVPGENGPLPSLYLAPREFFRALRDRLENSSIGLILQKNISDMHYGDYAPAGAMACNLVGSDACRAMFQRPQASTQQFIGGIGYRLNPVLHGVNVDQFLQRLLVQMSEKRGPGSDEFEKDFDDLAAQEKAQK